MEIKSGIYQIKNLVNGKIYIGSAVNINRRWREHKSQLLLNHHHCSYLQNAYNKYGLSNFEFSVLEYINDCSKLIECEQFYIDILEPKYNIETIAGSPMLGRSHSEETKRKMSDAQSGDKHWAYGKTGELCPNYGKRRTEEQRQRISKSLTGRHLSEEHKQKVSNALKGENSCWYGKTLTNEHKTRIGNSHKKSIQCIESGVIYDSATDVKRLMNINNSHILECCRGVRKTAGRFHWKYYNSEKSE